LEGGGWSAAAEMKTLDLEKSKRARVWLDDLPSCGYMASNVLTHIVPASNAGRVSVHRAAIELLVPLGPRSMYALIGGEYYPDNSNALEVEIATSDDGPLFMDSLASSTDVVKVGLPSEYVQGVVKGIDIGCTELECVSAGKLRIACSAHGAMWSGQAIYSQVTSMLVKLINSAQLDMPDAAIVKLLST
jgi:hypothetical protein